MKKKDLILYIDYMSQPSRAVLAFLKLSKIPFQIEERRILKGEHRKDDYISKFSLQRIPAVDDNGFLLAESHTIMRYLSQKYQVADNLYPKNLENRALVDQYLDWHHSNTRHCAYYLFTFFPTALSKDLKIDRDNEKRIMENALTTINDVFLKHDKGFIAGDQISIADISAVCEINQLQLIGYDLNRYAKLKLWLDRCMAFEELKSAHQIFNKLADRVQKPKL
jgi:glutathione S-transferase